MRSDPFRDVDRLTREAWAALARPTVMPLDAFRQGDQLVVRVDLPGVDPSSIDVTVENDVLTVAAERRWDAAEDTRVVAAERLQGRFRRQLSLGEGFDADRVEAKYVDGVLTVTVPLVGRGATRKIEVTTGAPRAIDAASSAA